MTVVRAVDKGQRYLDALDAARCNGNWHEIPELLKKISKHSPGRQCLIQTARAEYRIAERIKNAAKSKETSSASAEDGLLDLIPTLLSAMDEEGNSPQDIFQAQVCLGWLHWTLSEPALAASRLPKDFETTLHMLSGEGQILSPWTEVCIVKGGYIKGAAQALTTGIDDALQTMSAILPWASGRQATSGMNPAFIFWSARFLAKSALLASEAALSQNPPNVRTFDFALTSFRAWASHAEIKRSVNTTAVEIDAVDDVESTPSMWRAYYEFLSAILQQELPYTAPAEGPRRVQLLSEFRRVETVCENILLRNVKFPKAHTRNHQMEEWVEKVIKNWEVLCGPGWSDEDFGEGGQDAVSSNVLDIVYRAAAKTFHSTLILRRLFHVHAALAEFHLAMRAFDTYVDIVTNAKTRAENSEQRLDSLEDDETFIRTLSEGIIMLCCFGSRKEAEKAHQVTSRLEQLLSTLSMRSDSLSEANDESSPQAIYVTEDGQKVSAVVVSAAYRAVGVGLATWARWTPVNESRTSIQDAAATALEKSLAAVPGSEPNAATTFALGLLLAEMRDLDGAINHVRAGLISTNVAEDASQHSIAYSEDHDLIPIWHLLALLLSAKQEFEPANGVCEAALDLASTGISAQEEISLRSGHEESDDGRRGAAAIGVAGANFRQKESLIELQITQLALTEALHGPEAALNHSDELLSLFGRLFSGLGVTEADAQSKDEHLTPPKTSAETVRTFRGSIFGRRKKHQKHLQLESESHGHGNGSTAIGNARHGSLRRKRYERDASLPSAMQNFSKGRHRPENAFIGSSTERVLPLTGHTESSAARQAVPAVSQDLNNTKQPHSVGHKNQPPNRDVRLLPNTRFESPTKAVTRFPKTQAQRQALGLLVKIWLYVAGLYRRAALFDDAREACNEATKQASQVEALVAGQESSARALADAGWGGAKSSDELWAEIYAERGFLAEAQSQPYEAMKHFEEALMHFPDHPRATVGLANLLLNIYDGSLPAEELEAELDPNSSSLSLASDPATQPVKENTPGSDKDSPEKLNRLAARDRAYGLLSTLTKLGSAWDDSEAWFALSKAYEQGNQIEKAKEILWWCVELEDRKPIRHWWNVGSGGYVL